MGAPWSRCSCSTAAAAAAAAAAASPCCTKEEQQDEGPPALSASKTAGVPPMFKGPPVGPGCPSSVPSWGPANGAGAPLEGGPPSKKAVGEGRPNLLSLLLPKSQGEEAGEGACLVVDKDGRYLPVHCERLLLLSALGLCLNPIAAFYLRCIYMGYLSLLLFLTSLLHWTKPRLGWRRALDIFVARIVILIFCSVAVSSAPPAVSAAYLLFLLVVLGLHALSWSFARDRRHLEGTLSHVALHCVGTAANMLLFAAIGNAEEAAAGWADF